MTNHDNSTASQRQRLLMSLASGRSVTTLTCRHQLDIMHPGMRICELRKMGHPIETVWVNDVTAEGFVHRVARYIMGKKQQSDIFDFLSEIQEKQ